MTRWSATNCPPRWRQAAGPTTRCWSSRPALRRRPAGRAGVCRHRPAGARCRTQRRSSGGVHARARAGAERYELRYALSTAYSRLGNTAEASTRARALRPRPASGARAAAPRHRDRGRTRTVKYPRRRTRPVAAGVAHLAPTPRCRSSSTSRVRPASSFITPTARAPTNISSRRWGRARLFFDYDGDGWLDIFLVDSGSIADPAVDRRARHRLFHNRGNGTFEDVTRSLRHSASGVRHGRVRGRLRRRRPSRPVHHQLRTERALSQSAATAPSPTSPRRGARRRPRWSTGCAFADLDRDGDLDLWVDELRRRRSRATARSAATPDAECASTAIR